LIPEEGDDTRHLTSYPRRVEPRRLKRRVWPWVVGAVLFFWGGWLAVALYAYLVGW
jgi:hypothetical protein